MAALPVRRGRLAEGRAIATAREPTTNTSKDRSHALG
jgi:hypothetical protein